MRLSTRSRYGLRALLVLARCHGQGTISAAKIAEQQGLSQKYLETLFNSLKIAELTMSRRGPGGGWQLTRPPDQIRLSEVLPALEGSFALVECVDYPHTCSRTDSCATREIYVKIHEAIQAVLEGFTLEDLQHRSEELSELFSDLPEGRNLCSTRDD
jgi:Rrf2 family transcriptional regulator, cysteine metabolism repressor